MTEGCRERGELMADVWIGYTTVLETVMARMNQLCLQDRDRSVCITLCSIPLQAPTRPIPHALSGWIPAITQSLMTAS